MSTSYKIIMINIKELKCTHCGAALAVNPLINRAYCEYCHNKFVIESAKQQNTWENNTALNTDIEYQLIRDDSIRNIHLMYADEFSDSDAPGRVYSLTKEQLEYTYAFISYLSYNLYTCYNTDFSLKYENINLHIRKKVFSIFGSDYTTITNKKKEDIIPAFYNRNNGSMLSYLEKLGFSIGEPSYSKNYMQQDMASIYIHKTVSPNDYSAYYQNYEEMAERIIKNPTYHKIINDLFEALSLASGSVKGGLQQLNVKIKPDCIEIERFPYNDYSSKFINFQFHSNYGQNYNMANLPDIKMQTMLAALCATQIIKQTINNGMYDWDLDNICGPQKVTYSSNTLFYFTITKRTEQKEIHHYQTW